MKIEAVSIAKLNSWFALIIKQLLQIFIKISAPLCVNLRAPVRLEKIINQRHNANHLAHILSEFSPSNNLEEF